MIDHESTDQQCFGRREIHEQKEKRSESGTRRGKRGFGVTALSTTGGLASIFMSSMFMSYMTDYAGLGSFAAALATVLLLVARIFDALDDPLQSFLMDSAKPRKMGKYKPFFLFRILLTTVGTFFLYAMPAGIKGSQVAVSVWVILFYLVYDLGTSLNNGNLLYRTMTEDPNERAKLVIGPRLWVMILGMVGSALMAVIVSINDAYFHNYTTTYSIVIGGLMLIAMVISILGWAMVKEKHVVAPDKEDKVKITDIFRLFKVNKAMTVHFVQNIFSGFIWTLLFATPTYYVKWGYCADLTTGKVNMTLLGTYSLIVSMMMVPLLIGSIIATTIMKRVFKGNPVRFSRCNCLVQALGGAILFLGQITGLLQKTPAVFFAAMFIMALAIGIDFVPGSSIDMEIMDYTIYKTGKDRSALTGVAGTFLSKAQTALSSALVGAILIAIGYNVDSVTGDYVGELSALPGMLNWFIVIMGLVPAILGLCAFLVLGKYPITPDVRADMQKVLREKDRREEEA